MSTYDQNGVEVERTRSLSVVRLHGEHDLATRDGLLSALASELEEADLVIDVSQATFVDSSTLHAIVSTEKLARSLGRQLVVVAAATCVARRPLEICGLDRVIAIEETPEAALARLGDPVGGWRQLSGRRRLR